ncbi:MAG TPA: hypothetical protein VHW23_07935 [Kofleriaceae bacterium]|nr:hypothetical protein [Kofleriaceae bacterium]
MTLAVVCLSQMAPTCNNDSTAPELSGPLSLSSQSGAYTITYDVPSGASLMTVWLVEEAQGTNSGGGVFSWINDTGISPQDSQRTVTLHLFCASGHVIGADSLGGTPPAPVSDCHSPHTMCSFNTLPNGPCSCEAPNYAPNNPNSNLGSAHVHAEVFRNADGSDRVASNTLIINCI